MAMSSLLCRFGLLFLFIFNIGSNTFGVSVGVGATYSSGGTVAAAAAANSKRQVISS